jgi:hypothetical protein
MSWFSSTDEDDKCPCNHGKNTDDDCPQDRHSRDDDEDDDSNSSSGTCTTLVAVALGFLFR